MSTVLEKAVLLDETGQDIVSKLEEIKLAIGGSGDFIPLLIKVSTPPTKTEYSPGDPLDLTGLVVNLLATNGYLYDVTTACSFSPSAGTPILTDTTVSVTYTYETQTFTTTFNLKVKELLSISVTTPPTITEYDAGDTLDLSGIVVSANYGDQTSADVTNDCSFSPADGSTLSISDSMITITYEGKTTTQAITVNGILGAMWDRTASHVLTRTDAAQGLTDPIPYYEGMTGEPSSPFDNISPWKDIEVITDPICGKMVKIPKYYYKLTLESGSLKFQISPTPQTGFLTSPAHADRGDGQGERDFVYVGAYEAASDDYTSKASITPIVNTTRANMRSNIHNLASDVWMWDFAMYWTIAMLYIVEFADWDSQSKIGVGGSDNNAVEVTGKTESFAYHTGTNASGRDVNGHVKYRYIEDLWANCYQFVDGIIHQSNAIYARKNPSTYSDTYSSDDVPVGNITTYGAVIDTFSWPATNAGQKFEDFYTFAMVPFANVGTKQNYSEYITDRFYSQNQSNGPVAFGGNYKYTDANSGYNGLFCMYCHVGSAWVTNDVSTRIMKLPANT